MDLVQMSMEQSLVKQAPLAVRMRPQNLEEFVGQEHIIGKNKVLRAAIEGNKLQSVIFYGPSGIGKTALAQLISKMTNNHFETINAVMAGVADIKKVVTEAEARRNISSMRTIVFIDEIHRFNKLQQDALLPFVESGLIILIGATTENPMVSVNSALLSRTHVFKFKPLEDKDLHKLIKRALEDKERGLGNFEVNIDDDAINALIMLSFGDARVLLNILELAVLTAKPKKDNTRHITRETIREAAQNKILDYDNADQHYNIISAFIKSMRGSDPQAAVYWLARMLHAGEDPMFIARRMVICASEDVGLADSMALTVATSALETVKNIGMPEARITLAHAAIYIALAPKSNSAYLAIENAQEMINETKNLNVPIHLRDKSYNDNFGNEVEVDYKYPHDYEGNYVEQQYLPEEIKNEKFYIKQKNDK